MTKPELVEFGELLLGRAPFVGEVRSGRRVSAVVVFWPGLNDEFASGPDVMSAAVAMVEERVRRQRAEVVSSIMHNPDVDSGSLAAKLRREGFEQGAKPVALALSMLVKRIEAEADEIVKAWDGHRPMHSDAANHLHAYRGLAMRKEFRDAAALLARPEISALLAGVES